MKFDAPIITRNPKDASSISKDIENFGYDGLFTFEGPHDPFLPLSIAAFNTKKIQLITSIAVAFARNPMILANIAYDLQLLSEGRFILGLGSQIKPHIERRFSMPWSSPAKRMKDMVLAIKAIWEAWENGTKLDFKGEFYNHTLMTPFFNPGKADFGLPKIYLAGVGPVMTQVAGEVADGLMVHPFHTAQSMKNITLPSVKKGNQNSFNDSFEISVGATLILKRKGELSEEKGGECTIPIGNPNSDPGTASTFARFAGGSFASSKSSSSRSSSSAASCLFSSSASGASSWSRFDWPAVRSTARM